MSADDPRDPQPEVPREVPSPPYEEPDKRGRDGRRMNPASLANLKRGNQPAPQGNTFALNHGARSEVLLRDVSKEVRELYDALAEAAPVRDADGSLPAADVIAVERAARALKRYRHIHTWCELHGRIEEKTGKVKEAAHYEVKAEAELGRALDALGMTPLARSKLGLNIAQSFDLAAHWARLERERGGG